MTPSDSQNSFNRKPWEVDKLGIGVFLYAYAVFLGACYLFGFWRPIGFNAFPYIGLQDYVSAPLNRLSVLVATPLLSSVVVFGSNALKLGTHKLNVLAFLAAMYSVVFAKDMFRALSLFISINYHYLTEVNVLVSAALLFSAGLSISIYSFRHTSSISIQLVGLTLIQSSVSMAAGYSDGKTLFSGAANVQLLGNKELCDGKDQRDWVYLDNYGDRTFFMNTIDKRLCITSNKNMQLISREMREGL